MVHAALVSVNAERGGTEPLAALAHRNDAWCYPAVRPFQLKDERMGWAGHASAAMYRATAVNYLSQGADALYMMQV